MQESVKPEDIIVNLVDNTVRIKRNKKDRKGKIPKDIDSVVKQYLCFQIRQGESLEDLGLTGEGDLPFISDVFQWEDTDAEFKKAMDQANRIKSRVLFEKYQSELAAYVKNPTPEHKDAVSALEKIVGHMQKFLDSQDLNVILNVDRSLPDDMWDSYKYIKREPIAPHEHFKHKTEE